MTTALKKKIVSELKKLYHTKNYHIFYCNESFNVNTTELKNMEVDGQNVFYKVYPAEDDQKATLRWTDQKNGMMGFTSAVFLFNDPK